MSGVEDVAVQLVRPEHFTAGSCCNSEAQLALGAFSGNVHLRTCAIRVKCNAAKLVG